ncbi:GNAT family N-acetyltransferase [Actinophytocola oryzae]|uniref:Acetyltransferase (GNAT) family protein n=1 Tax=Actinophytocola oryzae TaxID=502181 RepID=A0A4V3FQ49_9PSEU|nr:GNAT family N-acetyltransferase [Actinophytocola oryzae]TDV35415.1 acetyltransferase (GNAT) family protein [Actinophytocola oryzae]
MTRFLPVERPDPPIMVTIHDGGRLVGVALRTPPWPMIGSGLPADPDLLDSFVAQWLSFDPELPAVTAPRENAEALAAAWVRATGGSVREVMASRLFRLGELLPPTTSGSARQATGDDIELLVGWRAAFELEALGQDRAPEEGRAAVRRMLEIGYGVVIWEDRGEPVSWAVASAPIDGMSRVGPVYTPREYRGRGYGSAASAAASLWARTAGADDVVLFADVANPTTNSIYQKIGYRPVYDSTELEFIRLPSNT